MEQESLAGYIDQQTPIQIWKNLMDSKVDPAEFLDGLKYIYQTKFPEVAEVVLESHCPNNCRHCIYPPNYHEFNQTLDERNWGRVLEKIHMNFNIDRFVFCGRSLNQKTFNIINHFKYKYPNIQFGIISDVTSIKQFKDDLIHLKPDWIDISIDGMGKDHDNQRNNTGSFQESIESLDVLKESGAFDKINIISCLTTINVNSILEMLTFLNDKGYKNFIITPITLFNSKRPDPKLQLRIKDFVAFLDTVLAAGKELKDSWIGIDIYDAVYAAGIKNYRPDLFNRFQEMGLHLEYTQVDRDNEMQIGIYPCSLNGISELIINSNGDIIPPMVMAMGKIPEKMLLGNMENIGNKNKWRTGYVNSPAFSFFYNALMIEHQLYNE